MTAEIIKKKKSLRDFFKALLLFLVIFALLEALSFFSIKFFFADYQLYPYNRIVSPYTVYYNNPGYNYGSSTIKTDPDEPTLCIDSNGFVSSQPLSIEKPEGTIRIFLLGGSALFGSGQSKPYDQIFEYPSGNYSAALSIAGCLQRKLDSASVSTKYEVINAACSGFTSKQSMALYLEKVHRFSPDFIIEMDGMNDLGNIIAGKETDFSKTMFSAYLDLISRNRNLLRLNTFKLVQLIQNRIAENKSEQLSESLSKTKLEYDPSKYTVEQCIHLKDKLDENAGEYLALINRYSALLRADSVKFIFVLQPLLNRKPTNKQLSRTESDFDSRVDPITLSEEQINAFKPANLRQNNLTSYDILHLALIYYFDLGFSDSLRKVVEAHSCTFLDGNQLIKGLGSDFEFFTDYCHLTPAANDYIAARLAQHIINTRQANPPGLPHNGQ
jgi:hypothetical protein